VWQSVGISDVEEQVYRALLRDPHARGADLARTLSLSPQRYRAAIHRLSRAGLLEPGAVNGNESRPVDPRVALGALIRDRQGELERLAADVEHLATDFYYGRLRAEPRMMIEVLEGDQAIGERLRGLLSGATEEIVLLEAPPYVMDGDQCAALETAALRRGVRYRCLYATAVLNQPDKLDAIAVMVRAGEGARLLRTVPLKLVVVDRRVAVLPFTASEDQDRFRCIVVQRSALTDALHALFDVLWRQGTAWPAQLTGDSPPPRRGTGALTEQEQSLLRYLAAGLTDEAIARQLTCSRRTLRRRVDGLLDKLGAASRFQAGALAAQRGWL
jgi:DNA-binding CsgD family transcriptional regulator/sugar-specific transcriptional regulator TrmB